MRRVLEKYARALGLEIVGTAANGRDALGLFDRHKPDLVSLDITMPLLDGLGCLKEIMDRRPETKVVIITALADRETGLAAMRLGAKGFIQKPFTEAQVRDEFAQVLGLAGGALVGD
ncbi:MAG: response regulator [Spirochaetes bacterium]|nr:response regulator [Spirochaetota bacterium]